MRRWARLTAHHLTELFEIHDLHGSGQLITFFAGAWDGDETALPLAEGVKLQFYPGDRRSVVDKDTPRADSSSSQSALIQGRLFRDGQSGEPLYRDLAGHRLVSAGGVLNVNE